jgi:hypothetical protein
MGGLTAAAHGEQGVAGVEEGKTEGSQPCSGGEGHRQRGSRGGGVSGAYGGSIGPLVEGRDGRERGSPRESEAAAEEHLDGERRWEGPVRGLCRDEAEEH